MTTPEELWPELEKIGEPEVRKHVVQNVYGSSKRPLVEEWLRRKEEERENAASARQDARDEQDVRDR